MAYVGAGSASSASMRVHSTLIVVESLQSRCRELLPVGKLKREHASGTADLRRNHGEPIDALRQN